MYHTTFVVTQLLSGFMWKSAIKGWSSNLRLSGCLPSEMKFFLVLTFVASALAMPDEAQDTILDVNDNTGENAEFSQVNDDSKEVENIPVDATATKSLCSIDMVALNAVINKAIHAKLANEPGKF